MRPLDRQPRPVAVALVALLAPAALHAQPLLEEPTGGAIPEDARQAVREALSEQVTLLGDPVLAPRPAADARTRMDAVAQRFPTVAGVQRQLARACFAAGDPACAERAFVEAARLAADAEWALEDLASFYGQRAQPREELAALDRLATAIAATAKAKSALGGERSRLQAIYERARDLSRVHPIPGVDPTRYLRKVIDLYPQDPSYLRRFIDDLVTQGKGAQALVEVARYRKQFPLEGRYFAQVEAAVLEARREPDKAEAVYRSLLARDPLAASTGNPEGLFRDFFDLLKRQGRERELRRGLLAKDRAGQIAGGDLALLVRLHLHDGDGDKARKVLDRACEKAAAPTELVLRARLYLSMSSTDKAVPLLYEAYRTAATPKDKEEALGEIGLALLSGDLGRTALTPLSPLAGFRLRHLASGPSVVGGIASLVFNQVPVGAEADLERVAAVRGNLLRAAAVLAELKKVAPRSPFVARLTAGLVEGSRAYKDHAAAIRWAEEFLKAFPKDGRYFEVARAACDSRWQSKHGAKDGAACFVRLLDEAYRRGDRREYDATLGAVTSAWTRERKQAEVVRLFWAEIGKHQEDASIYDRFLEHLSRHNLFDEELKVYEEGIRRFNSAGWYDRLARWHLRRRGAESFRSITGSLFASLDDETTSAYLESLVSYDGASASADTSRFYELMYRRALDRFPLDHRFARKLLAFYDGFPHLRRQAEALVKRHMIGDPELLARYLRDEAAGGRLERDLEQIGQPKNAVERAVLASGLVFLSRQEEAAQALGDLVRDFPLDRPLVRRHAALTRALGRPARSAAGQASALLEKLLVAFPSDEAILTEAGDYLAEAGRLPEAQQRYERIVALRPGDIDAYLRLASIDWDFFQFDAAANAITRARKQSGDPLRFADKLAAIFESKKDYPRAIAEYVRLAIGAERLDRPRFGGGDEGGGEGGDGEGYRGEGGDGDGEEGLGGSGQGYAFQRLRHLADDRGLADAVSREWKKAAASEGKAVLAYAAYLGLVDEDQARRDLLIKEAGRTTDGRVLERIVELGRGEAGQGEHGILLAALRRQAALGKGAPSYAYPLVDALVEADRAQDAERELRSLIERLDAGDEMDREESLTGRLMLADLLWNKWKRPDEAIAVRAEVAARSQGARQEELVLEVIAWRIERGALAAAEPEARGLLAKHPAEIRFVRPVVTILWKGGKQAEALALLEEQIAAVRRVGGSDGERRTRAAELRRQLVDRLVEAKRVREAVDQWIEIINLNPGNQAEVAQLHELAAQHKLVSRVVDYYARTAQKSNRDVRWPIVLAQLADLEGDPRAAARWLAAALAISPERTSLWQQRAEALLRAGDPAAAATAYQRLWELTDHETRWAVAQVRSLLRAERKADAMRVARTVLPDDQRDPGPWFEMAALMERTGELGEAWSMASQGLARAQRGMEEHALSNEEGATYARIAVRVGRAPEALDALVRLEDAARSLAGQEGLQEPWRAESTASAAAAAWQHVLPGVVASHALDQEARAFVDALRPRATDERSIDRMVGVVERAGRPDAARDLLRQGVKLGGDEGQRFQRRLAAALEAAHLDGELTQLLEKGRQDSGTLASLAAAYRRMGDAASEERALARWFVARTAEDKDRSRFAGREPLLDRYMTLLVERKQEADLASLARRGGTYGSQIADFLLARGRLDLGLEAVEALGRGETPAWRGVKRAGVLLAVGGKGAEAKAALAAVLSSSAALRPIDSSLGRKPDLRGELVSHRWHRHAMVYAEALRQAQQPRDAGRFAAAAVEDKPRAVQSYVEQGDALERNGDRGAAVAAYERGLQLSSADVNAIDHLARAWLAGGDRAKALATWERLITSAPKDTSRHRTRFERLMAAKLVDDARALFAARLTSGWKKMARSQAMADLRALRRAFPEAGPEWETYLRSLLDLSGWKDLPLLEAMGGFRQTEENALLPPAAREPYLRMGAARATVAERSAWLQAVADWGLQERHWDATLWAADLALASERGEGAQPPQWAILARARARFGKGDAAGAVAGLREWLRGKGEGEHAAAAALLAERKHPAEWEVRLDLAQLLVARSGHTAMDEVALGDALWHVNRRDDAATALRRSVVRGVDDLVAYRAAAASAEKGLLLDVARDLRRALAGLDPTDGANRVALARDEWRLGAADKGVGLAASLLGDHSFPSAVRRDAAELLGEMAAARVSGVSSAVSRQISGKPVDEAGELARAIVGGDVRRIKPSLEQLYAPRTTLRRLAEDAVKRGQPVEAVEPLRRLWTLGVPAPELRAQQFAAERAAGNHREALRVVEGAECSGWLSWLRGDGRADEAEVPQRLLATARATARAVEQEKDKEKEAEGRARLAAQLDSASRIGDAGRVACLASVVERLAPSDETRKRAEAARKDLLAQRRLYLRRFVLAGIDDLLPIGGDR